MILQIIAGPTNTSLVRAFGDEHFEQLYKKLRDILPSTSFKAKFLQFFDKIRIGNTFGKF